MLSCMLKCLKCFTNTNRCSKGVVHVQNCINQANRNVSSFADIKLETKLLY